MTHDFSGWVTRHDIECSDGVIIRHSAFEHDDGRRVPLVWNHRSSDPQNVLGHMILEHNDEGVYGYGYFNNSPSASHARELLKHEDVDSLSIGARQLKRQGSSLIHGMIYEVSLVLAGANPGAKVDNIIMHGDGYGSDMEEDAIIYPGILLHSDDEEEDDDIIDGDSSETVGDVLSTLNQSQLNAVDFLLTSALNNIPLGGESMKHNIFDDQEQTLEHSIDVNNVLKSAQENNTTFQKELLKAVQNSDLQHKLGDPGTYGIESIEMLFPEAKVPGGGAPTFYKDEQTQAQLILSGTRKVPFQRLKMHIADLTEDEARARGYIKGNEKLEQVFAIFTRETTPQTIYKKQRLDRDDIIDVEAFDLVAYINSEMRSQLEEEIARAILVGDGRQKMDKDKINEDKIRPIISDKDVFTIKKEFTDVNKFFDAVIEAMVEYKGSGSPTMFIDPILFGKLKMLKGTDGRYLTGSTPITPDQMANWMGVAKIVPTTLMLKKGALVVNLNDYYVGSAKGGEITRFSDFDIDFNQHKYLIETRLCGSLMKPFAAIHINEKNSKSPETLTKGLRGFSDSKHVLGNTDSDEEESSGVPGGVGA